jgi:hypothetical protein
VVNVEAFDSGPPVFPKAAQVDSDHTLRLYSAVVHDNGAVCMMPLHEVELVNALRTAILPAESAALPRKSKSSFSWIGKPKWKTD